MGLFLLLPQGFPMPSPCRKAPFFVFWDGSIPSHPTVLMKHKVSGETTSQTRGLSGSWDEARAPLSKICGVTEWWLPLSLQYLGFRLWRKVSQFLFHCTIRQSLSRKQRETHTPHFSEGRCKEFAPFPTLHSCSRRKRLHCYQWSGK